MIKKVVKLILIILWAIVIFMFSNDNSIESSKKSDGLIINTVEFLLGRKLKEVEKDKYTSLLVLPVRKLAHFTIYFILSILILSFLYEIDTSHKMFYLSIFLTFLYACSDEYHQTFVPGRYGSFIDVLIDTSGGIFGSFLYKIIYFRRKKHE